MLPKPDPHPIDLFTWSKKRVLAVVSVCALLSIAGVAGFLLVQEYRKPENTNKVLTNKTVPPDWKNYENQYWGIQFKYPGSWSAVMGSFADGQYYFSSEPLNFISELGVGQALLIVKTYNNWQRLPFEEWLRQQEDTYFPRGELTIKPASVKDMPAKSLSLKFKWPKDNVGYWEGYVISRSEATKYFMVLAADSAQTAARFHDQFEQVVQSLSFLPVKAK